MPIKFQCSCGQSYQVGDEYAGRKVKCTRCGKVQVVPGGAPPDAAPPLVASVASPQPGGYGAPAPVPGPGSFNGKARASLILGIASLALMAIIIVIMLVMGSGGGPRSVSTAKTVAIIFLILLAISAGTGITAIVLGAITMKPQNTQTRGSAIAGLVTGIVGTALCGTCGLLVLLGAMKALGEL